MYSNIPNTILTDAGFAEDTPHILHHPCQTTHDNLQLPTFNRQVHVSSSGRVLIPHEIPHEGS